MPVAAGIVGDPGVAAIVAGRDVATERGGAAVLDRGHDLELAEAEVAGVACPVGGAVGVKDVGEPERARMHRATSEEGGPRTSAGGTLMLRYRGTSLR